MKHAAHVAFERVVDHLVLLHAALAAETLGDDLRGVMIPIAGQITDGDLGVRNAGLDEFLDIACVHWHVRGS